MEIKKCSQCGKPVCFERRLETDPPEYDPCAICGVPLCPACGQVTNDRDEEKLCLRCAKSKIKD